MKKKSFFFLNVYFFIFIYNLFFRGKHKLFFFENEVDDEIEYLIKNPDQLSQTDPQKLFFT